MAQVGLRGKGFMHEDPAFTVSGTWERFVQLWEKNDAKKKAEKGQKFHAGCGHGRTPKERK